MSRAVGILVLFLIILTAGTGCWDVQDIKNRAFVTAIGLDATEGDESPKYKVTFEIVRLAGLRPQANEPASVIQTIEADSIDQAIEELKARTPRALDLAHFRLLLVGENKARENFADIADYFYRHPEMQKRFRLMFVHQGEAMEVLKVEPLFETHATEEIVSMAQLDPQVATAIARFNPFINFMLNMRSMEGKGLAARIMASEEGKMVIRHGAAVFDNWQLVGWLSSDETKAANWIVGDAHVSVEGEMNGGIYTYYVNKKSAKIIPNTNNDELSFTVKIRTDGAILQQQGKQLDLSDPKNIAKLENLFAKTISQQVQSAIVKAQKEFAVDYLGFGAVLKRRKPEVFRQLDWQEIFPITQIKVEVQSKATRTGISP